jgi:hypothetical protein
MNAAFTLAIDLVTVLNPPMLRAAKPSCQEVAQ